jgi:ferredoxin-NADP reductase/MOSC domain-containing protein YiiM
MAGGRYTRQIHLVFDKMLNPERQVAPARLKGIFVGRAAPLGPGKVASAFVKSRTHGPVAVGMTGLAGDEQADRKVHGGPDMAIYVYPASHYDLWRNEFPEHDAVWGPGSLGENLAMDGWDEECVCVGDMVRIGTALLQVTRPRKPCFKLALRFQDLRLPRHLVETGRCGWYYRVLQTGTIAPDDDAQLIDCPHPEWTIRRLNNISIRANVDLDELEELAALPELAGNWRSQVRAMAASIEAARKRDTFRRYRVVAIQDESRTIKSFQFAPDDGGGIAAAVPGQHVVLRLPPDGEGLQKLRSYSVSGVASAQHVQISVKREAAGGVSQSLHDGLRIGDTVEVLGPRGNFTLVDTSDTPLVLISAGVGVTPMMPMLHAATTNNGGKVVPRSVVFLHGARNSEEQAFGRQIRDIASQHPAVRCHVRFSQPLASDEIGNGHDSVGRIDKDLLEEMLAPLGQCNVYVCGPACFMADVARWVSELGIDATFRSESFGAASKIQESGGLLEGAAETAVTFGRTRKSVVWRRGGGSLLDLAKTQGLQIQSECRAGLCGSCATRVVSGSVGYDVQPVASIAPGEMLLCCGHPLEEELVLDI